MEFGLALAILGAAIAVFAAGIGSILGVSIAGQAGAGIVSEEPEKFGKVLILQLLPGSQGLYGFIGAFLVLLKVGLVGSAAIALTPDIGWQLLFASLPVGISGLISGYFQGKVSAAGMNVLAKKPNETGKAIILSVMVETYALFGLLATVLIIMGIK